jgi:hypothetical protein
LILVEPELELLAGREPALLEEFRLGLILLRQRPPRLTLGVKGAQLATSADTLQ